MADSEGKSIADSASTWMQVVFGGISVTIAIVGLVIAYFAWVQPHGSPSTNGDQPAGPVAVGPATTTVAPTNLSSTAAPVPAGTPLAGLTPKLGGSNVHRSGNDLAMPCGSGQTTDRQRVVEWDLLGRYSALTGTLTVSKAHDADSPLQLKILADGVVVADQQLTKGLSRPLSISISGRQALRVELTCLFPDGEIMLGDPALVRT